MAATIPSYIELYNSIIRDLETELGITIPPFGKSTLRAKAAVQAAKLKLYYYRVAMVQKNALPDLADPESIGGTLERFGRMFLGRDPFPATAAVYLVDVVGEIGAVIKANTTYKADDTATNPGPLFTLDTEFTFIAGTGQITVRALEGGTGSSEAVGDTMTATAPILNVVDQCTVNTETDTPTDAETTEEYRAKTLQAVRLEPQGGAAADYRVWAEDVAGVRTVFPYAVTATENSIDVYVESATAPGTAPAPMLAEVAAVIEQDPDITKPDNERGRRPLGVLNVTTKTVVLQAVDIEITGLSVNTSEVQATITAAIDAYLFNVRPFIAGADVLAQKNDILTAARLSLIIQGTIGTGNFFNSLTYSVGGVPQASTYTFNLGNIPQIGLITYV